MISCLCFHVQGVTPVTTRKSQCHWHVILLLLLLGHKSSLPAKQIHPLSWMPAASHCWDCNRLYLCPSLSCPLLGSRLPCILIFAHFPFPVLPFYFCSSRLVLFCRGARPDSPILLLCNCNGVQWECSFLSSSSCFFTRFSIPLVLRSICFVLPVSNSLSSLLLLFHSNLVFSFFSASILSSCLLPGLFFVFLFLHWSTTNAHRDTDICYRQFTTPWRDNGCIQDCLFVVFVLLSVTSFPSCPSLFSSSYCCSL